MTIGTDTITDAAMICPHGSSYALAPLINAIATGTVRFSGVSVNVSANRNSFHAATNASSPVLTSAGAITGANTREAMIHGEAPSMIAASSISRGTSRT